MIGYLRGELGQIAGELRGREAALLGLELVAAVLEEFGAGDIEPEVHVPARLVTGASRWLRMMIAERRLVGVQVRGEAALVADRGREPALGEHLLERVEHLRAVAQGLAEPRRTHREDHELLDVQAVVGVRAAVDDVHHRHRHHRLAPPPISCARYRYSGSRRRAPRRAPWRARRRAWRWRRGAPLLSVPSSSIIVASMPA